METVLAEITASPVSSMGPVNCNGPGLVGLIAFALIMVALVASNAPSNPKRTFYLDK